MKKYVFSILASLFVILIVAIPVYAKNNNTRVILPSGETFNRDYFAAGDEVQLDGTVNGDAYVAGGSVIVNGTINGDLLTAGGNVTIAGTIQGDVRVGGGNIIFSGSTIGGNVTIGGGQVTIDKSTVVQGSLVAGAGNLQILSPIGRGATIGGGNVIIANSVGGDILAGVGQLSLAPGATVSGNLTYWSEEEVEISDGASVSGTIKQEIPQKKEEAKARDIGKGVAAALTGFALFVKIADVIVTLVIGLLVIFLLPNYMIKTSAFVQNKLGTSLIVGFLGMIVIPILIGILFITILGIPLALFSLALYIATLWFARIFAMQAIGTFILKQTKTKTHTAWAFVAGLAVYEVLTLIPVIGWLLQLAVVIAGLGADLAVKRQYYKELRAKKVI